MIKTAILFALSIGLMAPLQSDFLQEQRKYSRVRTAISEKENYLVDLLAKKSLKLTNLNICITAFKEENLLEVYAKSKENNTYQLLCKFEVCTKSGILGPKRKQDDRQVPEGFYYIDRFNPTSYYYLSLGINYPNKSDKIKGHPTQPGSDIFIHGSCVSIGCLPITDEEIKKLYVLAIHARNNGQLKIPVYIFPFKMTNENLVRYKKEYASDQNLINFWENLKPGYDKWIQSKQEIKVSVDSNGNYTY